MSIIGNPITLGGGGGELNIDYGMSEPADTSKLWVPLEKKPANTVFGFKLSYGNLSTFGVTTPRNFREVYGPLHYYNGYIYNMGYNEPEFGDNVVVSKYNIANNSYQYFELGTKLKRDVTFFGNGKYIYAMTYIDGGPKLYSWDIDTLSVITMDNATVSNVNKQGGESFPAHGSTVVVDNNAYVFGTVGTNGVRGVYELSLENYSLVYRGRTTISPKGANKSTVLYYKNNFYIVVGSEGTPYIHRYNINDNTTTYLVGNGSTTNNVVPAAFIYNNRVYVVGGYGNSLRTIRVLSEAEDSLVTVGTLPNDLPYAKSVVVGTKVYNFGINSSSANSIGINMESPLETNHLFVLTDYSEDNEFPIYKTKDFTVNISPVKAYLGNSNGIAEVTNAYSYDTASGTWKPLSGESKTADMLNALNVLGVN